MLTPIFILTSGRSGSTLLMRLLAGHPGVLIRSVFPFETRACQYWYLYKDKTRKSQVAPFEPVTDPRSKRPYIPFQRNDLESRHWSQQVSPEMLAGSFSDITEAYYRALTPIEKKPHAVAFAEKALGLHIAQQIDQAVGAKFIVLIRDPRDVFFSIKAFNAKRGSRKFGETDRDEDLFESLMRGYLQRAQFAASRSDKCTFCRYESIIQDPEVTLTRLFQDLGLPCQPEVILETCTAVTASDSATDKHRTASVEESTGRWEREASNAQRQMFSKFALELGELGYE